MTEMFDNFKTEEEFTKRKILLHISGVSSLVLLDIDFIEEQHSNQ